MTGGTADGKVVSAVVGIPVTGPPVGVVARGGEEVKVDAVHRLTSRIWISQEKWQKIRRNSNHQNPPDES
jgi:hypothetical protein